MKPKVAIVLCSAKLLRRAADCALLKGFLRWRACEGADFPAVMALPLCFASKKTLMRHSDTQLVRGSNLFSVRRSEVL